MDDLYGGRPPFVRGSDTSEEAAESVIGITGKLRRMVYEEIWRASDGRTCDEVEERLGMRHQTASARIRELSQKGHIRDSGLRRTTRSGRPATVWKPVREPVPGQQSLFEGR